jgi:phosphoserine phosphatase
MNPPSAKLNGGPGEGIPTPERQLQDLHVLLEVARAMAAVTELDELLALILNSVRRVLGAERATLFLYDAATNELYSKIAHGTGEIRFPAERGIAGAAAQGRRTVNIPDAYADPRFNREVDRQTGYHTRCLLTVPLHGWEAQLVGVLQVLNKADGVFTPYDEHLAEALAAQAGVALQRARLLEHYVQKKQLESALALARDIQQNLLPKHPPRLPGYDIAGWCRPTDETGGDCFDFMPLDDGRLAVTVADATGHGIGAALVIAEARALFRALTTYVSEAGDLLGRANRLLCADLPEGRFVTAFLGVLDPVRHRFDYASAGHAPLFWYHADRDTVSSTAATGLPLGLFEPSDIATAPPVHFAPGDMGVFVTDGFPEAQNPQGEQFGQEQLTRLIVAHARAPAVELIRALEGSVGTFLAGAPQRDDQTVVVVKRCG